VARSTCFDLIIDMRGEWMYYMSDTKVRTRKPRIHKSLRPNKEDEQSLENVEFKAKLDELMKRVDQLEVSNDTAQYNLGIMNEMVELLKEAPAGRYFINRAINRYKLHYLQNVVLPRRSEQLQEIEKESMPSFIRSQFVKKELRLIKNVTRAINHRQSFEIHAAINIKDIMSRFFSKFKFKPIKSITYKEEDHART